MPRSKIAVRFAFSGKRKLHFCPIPFFLAPFVRSYDGGCYALGSVDFRPSAPNQYLEKMTRWMGDLIFEEKTLAKQPRQHTEGLPIINRLINGQSINECPLIGWLIPIQSPRRSQQHKAHEDHNNIKPTKITTIQSARRLITTT